MKSTLSPHELRVILPLPSYPQSMVYGPNVACFSSVT